MGLSEAHGDAVNSPCKSQGLLAWYEADLIGRSLGEQSGAGKSRDINDWRLECFQGAESAESQPPTELNGSFLGCLECWLEAAWQCCGEDNF